VIFQNRSLLSDCYAWERDRGGAPLALDPV
jgi:hypothetical protein